MFLHNQEWVLSTAKVPFSQYAKAVVKEESKEVFKDVFKGDNFCTIIGTQWFRITIVLCTRAKKIMIKNDGARVIRRRKI